MTLFRLFHNKQYLHAAAVGSIFDGLNLRERLTAILDRAKSPPEAIELLIRNIVQAIINTPEIYRVVLFAALEGNPKLFRAIWDGFAPSFELIANYLGHHMDSGEIRRLDAMAAARLIVGTAIYHYQVYEMYGGKRIPDFRKKDLSATYADILWAGMMPVVRLTEMHRKAANKIQLSIPSSGRRQRTEP